MTAAEQVVRMMLEGGMESLDYSPEDLKRYQELKAQQLEIAAAEDKATGRNTRMMDYATGTFTPEWQTNYAEFEKLRNRYNGMPPKQLAAQLDKERAHHGSSAFGIQKDNPVDAVEQQRKLRSGWE